MLVFRQDLETNVCPLPEEIWKQMVLSSSLALKNCQLWATEQTLPSLSLALSLQAFFCFVILSLLRCLFAVLLPVSPACKGSTCNAIALVFKRTFLQYLNLSFRMALQMGPT
jgi:hypothetical protein